MKRISRTELPKVITNEVLDILIDMAQEFPQSTEWRDIYDYLIDHDYPTLRMILDEVQKVKKAQEQAKEDLKSSEQKAKEELEWREFVKNADPNAFYGNMGEPTTPKEYKNRYGVWPPGFDQETGERLPGDE